MSFPFSQEDEVESWNGFIRELRGKCQSKPGNSAFWKEVCEVGRELSLISNKEAKKHGGQSKVTEKEAAEVSYLVSSIEVGQLKNLCSLSQLRL